MLTHYTVVSYHTLITQRKDNWKALSILQWLRKGSWKRACMPFFNNNSPEAWNNHIASFCCCIKWKAAVILALSCWEKHLCKIKHFVHRGPLKQNPLCACVLVVSLPGTLQAISPVGVVLWEVFSPLREGMGARINIHGHFFFSDLFISYLHPFLHHRWYTIICLIRFFSNHCSLRWSLAWTITTLNIVT